MKNRIFRSLVLFTAGFLLFSYYGLSQDIGLYRKVEGSWSGTLKFQGMELVLVFNIKLNEKDSLIATIDSPDQGAKDIPTSSISVTSDSLIIKAKALQGSFRGDLNADFSESKGNWKQAGMKFPLELKHSKSQFVRNRPQEPKPPYPYLEKEIAFRNPVSGDTLAGTLTIPDDTATHPAVILISGSGAQDRNEELMGHKPFLVLADHLSRNGIAVLRYDDRGFGKSGGNFQTATTEDFATDASAAIDFLKGYEGIDSLKIGLIGHSEGGMIAPMVASERTDVGFIVLMAGPGVTGEKILLSQTELISQAESINEEEIRKSLKQSKDIYTILRKTSDNDKASERIRKVLEANNKKSGDKNENDTLNEQKINATIKSLTSPWFRYFLIFNPVQYLSKVKCPVYAINGSLDLQVSSKENLPVIEQAMIFGGNPDYTIEEIPGVNHLFQTATTGSPNEYSKIEETLSPAVLEKISNWVIKTAK